MGNWNLFEKLGAILAVALILGGIAWGYANNDIGESSASVLDNNAVIDDVSDFDMNSFNAGGVISTSAVAECADELYEANKRMMTDSKLQSLRDDINFWIAERDKWFDILYNDPDLTKEERAAANIKLLLAYQGLRNAQQAYNDYRDSIFAEYYECLRRHQNGGEERVLNESGGDIWGESLLTF